MGITGENAKEYGDAATSKVVILASKVFTDLTTKTLNITATKTNDTLMMSPLTINSTLRNTATERTASDVVWRASLISALFIPMMILVFVLCYGAPRVNEEIKKRRLYKSKVQTCLHIPAYIYNIGTSSINTEQSVELVIGEWQCEVLCKNQPFEKDVLATTVRTSDGMCVCMTGRDPYKNSLSKGSAAYYNARIICGIKTDTAQGLLPGHSFRVDVIHAMKLTGVKRIQLFFADDLFHISPSERVYFLHDTQRLLDARVGWRELRWGGKSGKYNQLIDYRDPVVAHGERVRVTFKIGDVHKKTIWQVYLKEFEDDSVAMTFRKFLVGEATRRCVLATSANVSEPDAFNQINVTLRLATNESCNTDLKNVTTFFTTTENIQFVAMHNTSPSRRQNPIPISHAEVKKSPFTFAFDTFYVDSDVEMIVTFQLLQSTKRQANILVDISYKSQIFNTPKTQTHLLTVQSPAKQIYFHTEKWGPLPKAPSSDLSVVENIQHVDFCSYHRQRMKFTCVKVIKKKRYPSRNFLQVMSQHNRLHKVYGIENDTRTLYMDSAARIQTEAMFLSDISTTLLPGLQINISNAQLADYYPEISTCPAHYSFAYAYGKYCCALPFSYYNYRAMYVGDSCKDRAFIRCPQPPCFTMATVKEGGLWIYDQNILQFS